MAMLNQRRRGLIRYLGVGGPEMAKQGLVSQFPLDDVAVMGAAAIAGRLPTILSRVYGTVSAAVTAEPDAVVIIDSPEFTHPIAKRIRQRCPTVPIIDYVSPSVWAWRPGGPARCGIMSIMCWRCGPSSPMRMNVWAGRLARSSAIP